MSQPVSPPGTDPAFEAAVLAVFSGASPTSAQLDELSTLPVAQFDTCVLHLEHTQRVEVRFYALQALHGLVAGANYGLLDEGRKQRLRGDLLALGRSGDDDDDDIGAAQMPLFIRNKLAQVIVAIAAAEYPATWPTFFTDVLASLNERQLSIDCFSRILISIHEDIISLEVPRSAAGAKASMTFKDAMRDGPDAALERVARAWLEVLKALLGMLGVGGDRGAGVGAGAGASPAEAVASVASVASISSAWRLIALVLNGVERYVNWVDIGLVANGPFIAVLFDVLNSEVGSGGSANVGGDQTAGSMESVRGAQVAAIGVLSEIVVKKMEAGAKLQLIESLGLVPLGARWAETGLPGGMGVQTEHANPLEDEDHALGVASAKLLVGLATEILDAWKKVENGVISLQAVGVRLDDDVMREATESVQKAAGMLEQLFPSVVRVLRVPEDEVSVIVAPFMLGFVSRMKMVQKRCGELGAVERGQLVRVLEGAAACARFSRESRLYAVQEGSVEERVVAEEEEQRVSAIRQDVFSLWRNTAKLVPNEAYALVASMLRESCGVAAGGGANATIAVWQDAEIALSLFYQLGEGVTEDVLKAGTHPSVELAAAIIQLDDGVAGHRLVALALLEACARYAKVTLFRRELLPALASKFFGKAGLGHPASSVPPRAAYLLCRTVKSLRQAISGISREILGALMPHLDAIARSPIQDAGGPLSLSPYARPSGLVAAGASASVGVSGAGVSTPDDRMFAFEAAGLLVGSSDNETIQVEWLQALTRPLMEQLQRVDATARGSAEARSSLDATTTGARDNGTNEHNEQHIGALCRQSLEALTRIGKGFASKACATRPKLAQALLEPLVPAIQAVQGLATHKDVRVKFLAYMHRLVECLGTEIVPHLPNVFWALDHPRIDAGDFKDTLVLVNQIIVRFANNQTVIDSVIIPLFTDCSSKVHDFLGSDWDWSMRTASEGTEHQGAGSTGSTEALREKVELQKQYYSLVNSVSQCASIIDRVLLRDSAAVSDVFKGAVSNVNHGVRKLCIATLAAIVTHWVQTYPGDGAVKEAACVRYGCDVLLFPLLVKPESGGVDIRDASSISLLSECANQIKSLATSSFGDDYLNALGIQLSTRLGWSEAIVGEVTGQIRALDGRSLRTYLKSMIVEYLKTQ